MNDKTKFKKTLEHQDNNLINCYKNCTQKKHENNKIKKIKNIQQREENHKYLIKFAFAVNM